MSGLSSGRLMRMSDVEHEVGMGASTIYRKIAAGTFPPPIKIDGNMSRWWEGDIRAWIDALRSQHGREVGPNGQ